MCHPERSEESPLFSPKMRCFASLSMTGWRMSRRATPFLSPRASLFCRPEASAEGSLGTGVPREDKVGNVAPSHPFFVAPRRQPRGPSALACLRITSQSAVPNEVRDASLSLGRTKNGRSAGQGREGTFLNNPNKKTSLSTFRLL